MKQSGGGVCIYTKKEINGHNLLVTKSTTYKTLPPIESIWLNIEVGHVSLTVACIYRPGYTPEESNTDMLLTLKNVFIENRPAYVFGDFNYPHIDWKKLTVPNIYKNEQDFFESYLEMNAHQLITFPTRYRNNQSSLLDLVLVNNKKTMFNINSDPPIGRVIVCKSQIIIHKKPTKKIWKRNFWNANYEDINAFLSEQDYRPQNSDQTKYERCEDILHHVIAKCVPLKPYSTNTDKPWLCQHIFKEIKKKRNVWDRYRQTKSFEDYRLYRKQNNKVKKLIKTARSKYEDSIACSNSPKQFFKYIRYTLHSKIDLIALKDPETDSLTTNNTRMGELFAEQFNKVFTRTDNKIHIPILPPETRSTDSLTTIQFNADNVSDALLSLRCDSSPGPDNIPAIFLQKCHTSISAALADSMNECMSSGKLPASWHKAVVTPLFKKGNKHLAQNFRPISLTCNPCKCLEKVIVRKMTAFLLENGTLSDSQHGFLPRRSVVTNLLSCLDVWSRNHDQNLPTDVVYLDFEKAFDKVPHDYLIYKLEHFGIRGKLLDLIKNFLYNRYYQVRVNSVLSEAHPVISGVPQGSVLGPLLFLVYISDLTYDIKTNIIFFADDAKLYANPLNNCDDLRHDLAVIENWATTWKMKLNESKCSVLTIGSKDDNSQYVLNNVELQSVKEQNDLGIVITSDLKWENHINKITKKANALVYMIQRAFQNMSANMLKRIYISFIRPKLEYAQVIWSPYLHKDAQKLERVQRRITKIPHELRNETYESRLKELQLTTLTDRRLRGDLIETYKIMSGCYSANLETFHTHQHPHLRGHSRKLAKERTTKLVRKIFLTNRVVYAWNSLTEETVAATSVNSFKKRIDKEVNFSALSSHYTQ